MDINAVKSAYRRYAPGYDLCFGPILDQGRRKAVAKMNCRPGERVLEVGVGTGLSLPLYESSVQVVGIDISPEMLERAEVLRERLCLGNVAALKEMDAERMAFPADSFDKVVAMYVVSVAPDPVRVVNEMRRVCKPDGELFIVNHFRHPNRLMGFIERLVSPLSNMIGFKPDFSLDEFLRKTQLDVLERMPVNFFGYWTMLRATNRK
ncbi:class I SAM-dependent methyltransferase [Geobacter sp. DSM 9736]|uniref:class I SAM-dependent methyltransferase n=1 Tax=Geobacter sp. DSM 9736 TaxID=1277350 RepID=UPI000B501C1A|nr:methyltransferase domain-containing protein [Geobacter sp. DSM 9736]SNB47737.1 phosphatidylethanolamine N-methyltransferase /phosphatidyl-N-methylethanolamine N-methyltransferase [Geobacter sp. DSM 9736]